MPAQPAVLVILESKRYFQRSEQFVERLAEVAMANVLRILDLKALGQNLIQGSLRVCRDLDAQQQRDGGDSDDPNPQRCQINTARTSLPPAQQSC